VQVTGFFDVAACYRLGGGPMEASVSDGNKPDMLVLSPVHSVYLLTYLPVTRLFVLQEIPKGR